MTIKFASIALASLLGVAVLNAQDTANLPARKTIFQKDKLGDHTFIEVGNFATVNYGGTNNKLDWNSRVNYVIPHIAVGRWHRPYFATRAQILGGEMKDYSASLNMPDQYRIGYHQFAVGQFDVMFDLVNYFMPYREKRFLHLIPFVGMGVGYNWKSTVAGAERYNHRWTATAHVGLQLKMRLSERVDFNLESQLYTHDYFRQADLRTENGGLSFRATSALGASLTFHLGKKEFTPIVPEDQELMRRLNDQINSLRAENAELSKRPERCPDPIPVAKAGVKVGNVVYFRLNSDKVDANQMINIHHIAQYAQNNNETITLVGYADRKTGTPDYNYKLSERRARAVAKILVEKYGIAAERIKTSWEGDREQPYAENVWNRVVIMNAE